MTIKGKKPKEFKEMTKKELADLYQTLEYDRILAEKKLMEIGMRQYAIFTWLADYDNPHNLFVPTDYKPTEE
jgi:hypothetical protein